MKYTKDNIIGLVVKRGGYERYKITGVFMGAGIVTLKMLRNGRNYEVLIDTALTRLNNDKWVVTHEKVVEEIYQIY